jgi:membrane protein DedA with SNARE-associated domain
MLIASLTSSLVDQLRHVSSGWVYLIVALLVFGEAALFIGFVLPGETAVIVAGVIASQGKINITVLCALVVVSAIAGDSVGYFVGQHYGERLMTLPLIRGRHIAVERALEGLRQRGPIYVFIGRFTAFLRAVMPGLAGMSKMHYRRFLAANAAGGLLWGVTYSLLGYFAGGALNKIEHYASWAGISLLVIVIAVVVVLHYRRKRRDALSDAQWVATHPDDSAKGG